MKRLTTLNSLTALFVVFALVAQSTATATPKPLDLGADKVTGQITGMPTGTHIEIRLKNKQTLRGTRGEVSASGFSLADPSGGNRQIAFDEVSSVKQMIKKSHTTRNVLIGVGIAVVVVAVLAAGAFARSVSVYN